MNPQDPATPIVNFARFSQRLDGDVALMRELAELYLSESVARIEDLKSAAMSGDAHRVHIVSHSIKGAARNFSAVPAAEAAQALEDLGEAGDVSGCGEAIDRLVFELRRLQDALESFLKPGPE